MAQVKVHLLVPGDGPIQGGEVSLGAETFGDKAQTFFVACRPGHPRLPQFATGEWRGTTCPECQQTEAYLTAKTADERALTGELED